MTTFPLSPRRAFLSGVMTEAWKLARVAAAATGRGVPSHLSDSLRRAWAAMRAVSAAKAARAASLARQVALDLALAAIPPASLTPALTRAGRGIPAVSRYTQGSRH